MLIDSHAHLDFEDYDKDLDTVIKRARQAGLEFVINIGTNADSNNQSVKIAKKYDIVFTSVGIHPHEADEISDDDISLVRSLAKEEKVIAIGETGLDFYKNYSKRENQERLFKEHLAIVREMNLPVILHIREAHARALDILKSELKPPIRGVAHCFSGNRDELHQYLSLGLYISIAGPVTFPNARRLREVAREIPTDRLLIETDCPYLSPQAHRGKRNEPAYVKHIAETLAEIHRLSVDEIARMTTHNAKMLFGISEPQVYDYRGVEDG